MTSPSCFGRPQVSNLRHGERDKPVGSSRPAPRAPGGPGTSALPCRRNLRCGGHALVLRGSASGYAGALAFGDAGLRAALRSGAYPTTSLAPSGLMPFAQQPTQGAALGYPVAPLRGLAVTNKTASEGREPSPLAPSPPEADKSNQVERGREFLAPVVGASQGLSGLAGQTLRHRERSLRPLTDFSADGLVGR